MTDAESTFWRPIDPENFGFGWDPLKKDDLVQIGCSDKDYARLERGEHVQCVVQVNGFMMRVVLQRPQTQMELGL